MTIERGQTWGEPSDPEVDDGLPVVGSDAELAEFWAATRDDAEPERTSGLPPVPMVRLSAGDLLKTLGLDRPRLSGQRYRYPVDIGLAHLRRDRSAEETVPFAAHLTVRNRPLSGLGPGLSLAVMNAAWLGDLRLGPRAHPNDGLLDVTEGVIGLAQRREGTRRARSGAHLPHPALSTSRGSSWEQVRSRPVQVWIDGRRRGRFRSIRVESVPDALIVIA